MTPEPQERIPYIGPLPFLRQHRDLFFGRDNEVSELLSLVISHRVLLLYAQSGAGKTSLLNAGLVPVLEDEGFEVLPLARVAGLIPKGIESGEITNVYVFNTLMSWSEQEEADPGKLPQKSLADFLRQRERLSDEEGRARPRVVIFDQFEELFSSYQEHWTERKEFFERVADILVDDPLLRVVFAIREDYIAQLDPYAHLLPERLRTRYRLERLRAEAACQAVERPLRDTGRTFAEGVALRLVNKLLNIRVEDAAGEIVETPGQYVEPVQLQIVCQSLWRNLPKEVTVIIDDHIERFGDVQEVLRSFYERAIEAAKRQTRVSVSDLRRWFNDKLITPAGTRGTVFQGKEQTEGIKNEAVDVLEAQHIIRAERRAGARWYELTHDRLIEPICKSNAETQARRSRRLKASLITICALTAIISIVVFLRYYQPKTYSLAVTGFDGSVVKSPDPNQTTYKHGETVILKAVPNEGYIFTGWSVRLSDSNNPATLDDNPAKLVMDGDKSVTANFAIKTYSLTVTAFDGSVVKSPDPNQTTYKHGETVILKAVPKEGYSFVYWSGDLSESNNPTTLVMDADKSVTASFVLNTYSLIANAVDGSITKVPDQARYKHGEEVVLKAVPKEEYSFVYWSGDLSESNNPTTLVMDADKSVNASFALRTDSIEGYSLTVFAVGGSVTKRPDRARYEHREKVTLEAVPSKGYSFTNWSDALSGSTNPASLVIDADKSLTANFAPKTYSLTATAVIGSVKKNPDQISYEYGGPVTLVAVPNSGYYFTNWSGDLSDSNNPATLIMDADKSVTANFAALKVKAGDYVVTSLGSNKCLNVEDIRNVEAKYQYYGNPNQQWSLRHVGRGYYRIMAKGNEKMSLEIVEGRTNIQLNEWQDTDNQKWALESAGKDCYKIIDRHSGKCLDIDELSERVILNTGGDDDSQKWIVQQADSYPAIVPTKGTNEEHFIILSKNNDDRCVAVKDDGDAIIHEEWEGRDNQRWRLVPVGDGYFRICTKDRGDCLTVKDKSVVRQPYVGDDSQKWRVKRHTEISPNFYEIKNKQSDLCLTFTDNSIVQDIYGARENQKWELKPAEQSWIGSITVTMKDKLPQGKGWEKIPVNLNEGVWLSPAIWLWVRGPARDNITVTSSKGPEPKKPAGEGWKRIPVNLNEGREAKYIYLWVRGPARDNITVTDGRKTKRKGPQGRGWMQIGPDLNEGAWGKYLYLWVR